MAAFELGRRLPFGLEASLPRETVVSRAATKENEMDTPTASLTGRFPVMGATADQQDLETRERIRAWVLYEMKKRQIDSLRQMARLITVSHTYLQRIVSREQKAGLEFVLRMHRKLHISLDTICDQDPPSR